jgi:hypothetical protein
VEWSYLGTAPRPAGLDVSRNMQRLLWRLVLHYGGHVSSSNRGGRSPNPRSAMTCRGRPLRSGPSVTGSVRCRINRLTRLDRATGEPIRRYEHEWPGDLTHVDVKKLSKVPDGGGWRYLGRQRAKKNRHITTARTGGPRSKCGQPCHRYEVKSAYQTMKLRIETRMIPTPPLRFICVSPMTNPTIGRRTALM